jgi:hypothetical protein
MDIISFKTSGGYEVKFKPFLTYDQFIELQKIWTKDMVIDPNKKDDKGKVATPEMPKISPNLAYDANKMLVGFLIVSILDPKGAEVTRASNELPVPFNDGDEIMSELDKISKAAYESFEKKSQMTSSNQPSEVTTPART